MEVQQEVRTNLTEQSKDLEASVVDFELLGKQAMQFVRE